MLCWVLFDLWENSKKFVTTKNQNSDERIFSFWKKKLKKKFEKILKNEKIILKKPKKIEKIENKHFLKNPENENEKIKK